MRYEVDFVVREYGKIRKTYNISSDNVTVVAKYFFEQLDNGKLSSSEINEPLSWDNVSSARIFKEGSFKPHIIKAPGTYGNIKKAFEKLGGKCVICGTTEKLEFDHIDRATKSFNITSHWRMAWEDLEKEVDKCQLLCYKHHKEKTIREREEAEHGLYRYRSKKYRCRCEICVAAKAEDNKKYTQGKETQ